MDWTLSTERTAWELVAAVAIFLFCGVGASAFLKTTKIIAVLRFCFLLAAATLFFDPILTRRVEEKPTVVLTLDDSASARRPLNVGGNERGNVDNETVWTRCVSLAKATENAARRRGFSTELRTLSGRTVASLGELSELETPSATTSPLLKLAANGASRRLEGGEKGDVRRRERILLFSDGIQNDGNEPTEDAKKGGGEESSGFDGEREGGVSVDAVAVGVSTGKLDWRWGVVDASSTVYPGGVASLRAELRLENGGFETSAAQEDKREEEKNGKGGGTRRAVVRLWETPVERTGEKETANAPANATAESAKLVWERVVDVAIDANGGGVVRVERDWKPEQNGVFDYLLFVADFDDAEKLDANLVENAENLAVSDFSEFCLFNNATRFRVEAKAKKLDVLLVDDEPRYEYRYLSELLRREEGVALKTLLFCVDDAVREGDETALAPRDLTRRRLAEFDAILIGDVPLERWAGKAQTLVDVATQDGSETSIWLLGGAKTFQVGESGESLAALLAPNLLNGESETNGEESVNGAWRLLPTPRGRDVFAELAPFWAALDANETGKDVELTRVWGGWTPGVGAETLFNARNASTGRETPLFVVATLGKNKVLAQGTDELWRLRTLGDKTIYRRFVLRALEFLADGGDAEQAEDAVFANASTAEESAGGSTENGESGSDAAFDSGVEKRKIKGAEKTRAALALETQDVAARIDVLQEIARTTGGETLDLRDLDEEAARAAATAFFERRFGEYPNVVVERSTRTPGKNWLFAALFVFWSVAWALERRLDGAR
ncbi:MAG: hypothetical protein IKK39_01425 [Thermoguttaceae bacterium]|nr:hypothetical protein [Thermoguttaceae bacterium]